VDHLIRRKWVTFMPPLKALAEALEMEPPLTDAKLAELFAALRTTQERERGQAWHDCEAHREAIKKWLEQKVRLTKVRKLLQRHHQVAIPYSTLHRFAVAELEFGRRGQRSVRLVDGEPGQELQVDTGWVVTLTVGQKRIRKKAFIFTPNVSRYRFVYPIESETTETAIKACEAAWTFYGGVFAVLLPDNTKAIINKASSTSPQINELFLEYAQARGFAVDPARVRKPKDKGRVEKTVSYVRDDCFGGEVLTTLQAASTRALFWAEHEAGVTIHRTTKRRPKEHFESEERAHLRPAPTEPYDIPQWATVTVDKTQHVAAFEALYMLPETLRHATLRARADQQLVRFYHRNELVKLLPRAERGGRSFDKEDIPEHLRAYAMRDEAFLAEQARLHGEAIGDFADRLLEGPAPWTRMRQASALLGLVRRFGKARVERACRRALDAEMYNVDRLRRMLEQPAKHDNETKQEAQVIPIARYLRPSSTWAINKDKGETR
jgi:hypothetical protein